MFNLALIFIRINEYASTSSCAQIRFSIELSMGKLVLFGWSIIIMRRSNCSAPITPGQPRGQRKYACDKKGGALEKSVMLVII